MIKKVNSETFNSRQTCYLERFVNLNVISRHETIFFNRTGRFTNSFFSVYTLIKHIFFIFLYSQTTRIKTSQ
jgi:hypothetical protein